MLKFNDQNHRMKLDKTIQHLLHLLLAVFEKCHAVQVHKVLAPPQAWNLNNLTYYCKQSVTDQISNINVVTCSYWQ